MDVVVTSGGLGPTADDLTAEVVGRLPGPRDGARRGRSNERIAEILRPLATRWPHIDMEADRGRATASRRRSRGARPCSSRSGPRRGWWCRRGRAGRANGPTVVVLPGPPRELQPMWRKAVADRRAAGGARGRQRLPAAHAAPVRDPRVGDRRDAAGRRARGGRARQAGGHDLPETGRGRGRDPLRARRAGRPTTRSWRSSSDAPRRHAVLAGRQHRRRAGGRAACEERPPDPAHARPRTIATAESCTGGLLAARLTELAGASDYFSGGIVAYSNEAKIAHAGVARELIETHGAVSAEVAQALADGARAAPGRGRRRRDHRRGGPGRRQRAEAGRARVAERHARRATDRSSA